MALTKQSSRRSLCKEVAMKCPQRNRLCSLSRPREHNHTSLRHLRCGGDFDSTRPSESTLLTTRDFSNHRAAVD